MNRFISFFRSPKIEFYCDPVFWGAAPEPVPAVKAMPEWFKKIAPYMKTKDERGRPGMSAKKCLPMMDAQSLGYVIPLFGDQHVKSNHDLTKVEIGSSSTLFPRIIERHSIEQTGGYGNGGVYTDAIKFINPWIVKTPPGWSTLFVPHINGLEDRFLCLSGLVDTDKYPKQVNFPAKWLKANYDGVLEGGTPLVTAIPIKRSDMLLKHDVHLITEAEQAEVNRIHRAQQLRAHVYTHELREKRVKE